MDKLKRKGQERAEAKVQKTKAALKAVLRDELRAELRNDISVEDTEDGVVVSSRRLGKEMIDNSSLRDVAFLMRGVR